MNSALARRTLPAALVAAAALAPLPAAGAQPYGPDTCVDGFVWREAAPGDNVCVTPATRDATAAQNAQAVANRDPQGAYGSNSCKQGFVWREAFDGDVVCVTPDVRAATKADNAAAASRKAGQKPAQSPGSSTVVFEVSGAGEVFNIVTDPPTAAVTDHTALPWSRQLTVTPDEDMLQVVATGRDVPGPGCRIILDGQVVAEQPVGGSAHCIWTR